MQICNVTEARSSFPDESLFSGWQHISERPVWNTPVHWSRCSVSMLNVPHLSGGCCSPGNDYLCVHKKSLMFYFNSWKIRDQNQKCCVCNLVRRVAHFALERICFPQLRFSLLLLFKSSDSTRLSSSLIILNIKHFFFIGFHSQTFHGSVVARKLDPAITTV